jgi:Coenzyme PQQ synthesis protein D (PqqD)
MKRAHPNAIETPDDDAGNILLLRLPGHHESHRLSGAAVVMWNAWKRGDLEAGVQAVLKKYRDADPDRVRADAERIHRDLERQGLIVER